MAAKIRIGINADSEIRDIMKKLLIENREAAGFKRAEMAQKIGRKYNDIYRWETFGDFTIDIMFLYVQATQKEIVIPVLK